MNKGNYIVQYTTNSDLPSFSMERSSVFIDNLLSETTSMPIISRGIYAIYCYQYDGNNCDSLFIYSPTTNIDIKKLELVINELNIGKRNVIIKNICDSKTITSKAFNFKLIENKSNLENINYYPLETTFPQTIYVLPPIESIERNCKPIILGTDCNFIVPTGSTFKSYREMLFRLNRKYRDVIFFDYAPKQLFIDALSDWNIKISSFGKSIIISNQQYKKKEFIKYWYSPIINGINYAFNVNNSIDLIKRGYQTELERGGWIGSVENNILFVHTIIHSRKPGLFGDLLLIDIINYAILNNFKKINLGGCETIGLFQYKSKYISAFEGSFYRKSMSYFCNSKMN